MTYLCTLLIGAKVLYLYCTHLCTHAEPSGYPSEVKIFQLTSTSITFQWQRLKCQQENGPITGYQYRVYHDLFQYSEGTVECNTTMVTLYDTNVRAFSVAAMNEAGIGEHSPLLKLITSNSGEESWRKHNL